MVQPLTSCESLEKVINLLSPVFIISTIIRGVIIINSNEGNMGIY